MKEAIKLAVEGGYVDKIGSNHSDFGFWQVITSDHLFWQALGKSLGWSDTAAAGGYGSETEIVGVPIWEHKWHRLVHHLAEGKNPDDFFKDLLT